MKNWRVPAGRDGFSPNSGQTKTEYRRTMLYKPDTHRHTHTRTNTDTRAHPDVLTQAHTTQITLYSHRAQVSSCLLLNLHREYSLIYFFPVYTHLSPGMTHFKYISGFHELFLSSPGLTKVSFDRLSPWLLL